MKKIIILAITLFISGIFSVNTKADYQEPFSNVRVVVTDLQGNIIDENTERLEMTRMTSALASSINTLSFTSKNIVFGSDIKSTVEVSDDYIGGIYYRTVNFRNVTMKIVGGNMSNIINIPTSSLTSGKTTDSESRTPVLLTIQASVNDSRMVYHYYTIYTDKYNVNPIS